jgi:pimeloyl-ACP methyl ester carboxylesterase
MSMDNQSTAQHYRDCYFEVPDGLRLHYRDYPGDASKPPLLCLPGLTRNARDFAEFAERYSPRFRVLALDFRGRALSDYDPQPERYMPFTYAKDVIELLDQLQVPEAIFVGTSLGGLVTMAIAVTTPDRIVATIMNDVGPDVSEEGIERIKSYVGRDVRFADWEEAGRTIAANVGKSFEHRSHDGWVANARRNCREENGEVRFDYDMAIAVPFQTANSGPQVDLWPFFKALAAKPLLVVRGANSDLLTAETAERMKAEAPGMQLATVAGVGHAPDLDEPEAVAAIDEFLDSLDL